MITEDKLIFLISQPRSGSTVLQKILSNNQYISTTSEPWILLPIAGMMHPDLNNSLFNSSLAIDAVNDFITKEEQGQLKVDLKKSILVIYNSKMNKAEFFLDKTPRYYEIFDFIQEFFPQSKIVILKRNPFAVLNSIIETWRIDSFASLTQYYRDILIAPFLILDFIKKNRNNPNVLVIKYEDLVEDADNLMCAVFNWLKIPYNKSYLEYNDNEKLKGKYGDGIGVHKFPKITDEGVGLWNSKFDDSNWKDFFKGYAHYLGDEFLSAYGKYSAPASKKTQKFDDYKFFCEKELTKFPLTSFKAFYKLSRISLNFCISKLKNNFAFKK